jgi:hypothetical protein
MRVFNEWGDTARPHHPRLAAEQVVPCFEDDVLDRVDLEIGRGTLGPLVAAAIRMGYNPVSPSWWERNEAKKKAKKEAARLSIEYRVRIERMKDASLLPARRRWIARGSLLHRARASEGALYRSRDAAVFLREDGVCKPRFVGLDAPWKSPHAFVGPLRWVEPVTYE